MGLLAPVLAAAATPSPFDDFWYQPRYQGPGLQTYVSPDLAMTIPAVYACVGVIAEDIAKVPLSMYEDLGDQGNRPARNHPLQDVLHDQPNDWQTSIEFREMMTAFALLRGKGIAEIKPGPRGPVDQLVPLHPDLIHEERGKGSTGPRFVYRDPMLDGDERVLLYDEVFVVRGRYGRSVLDYARRSFASILAQMELERTFNENGAKHQGVITHPKQLQDPARTAIRAALDQYAVGGPRAGRPLLLEDGMTWHDVSIAPRDAEFLAQRQFGVDEVCRWFRVPPHKIANLDRSTNNNIEKQSTEYVTDTLLAWAERWEQAILRDLVLAKGRFYAKLLLDGLLRGDIASRFTAYAVAIQWGFMTRNEVREREDLNPIDGLDEPLTPTNMGTSGPQPNPNGSQAELPRIDTDAAAMGHLRLLAADAASRIARKEHAALARLAERASGDPRAWREGVVEFFAEHGQFVASVLKVPEDAALAYARRTRDTLLAGDMDLEDWIPDHVEALTALAFEEHSEGMAAPPVPRPTPIHLELHQAPITVSPAPVTIAEGAVHAPITFAEGAIRSDVHAPVTIAEGAVAVSTPDVNVTIPPARPVAREVERDADNRIVRVREVPLDG